MAPGDDTGEASVRSNAIGALGLRLVGLGPVREEVVDGRGDEAVFGLRCVVRLGDLVRFRGHRRSFSWLRRLGDFRRFGDAVTCSSGSQCAGQSGR